MSNTNRRTFIKTMFAGAVGLAVTQNSLLAKSKAIPKKIAEKTLKTVKLPINIVFSKKESGMWNKKDGSHAPVITINKNMVTIETKHGMSKKHYIVRHTLVTSNGVFVAARTFYPDDKKAISTFELPKGEKSFIATSYCNLHDLWITEFSL